MKVKLRIVGIGNSIVNGFPLKRSECFLSLLRETTGQEVINKGVNGETTEDIVKRFSRDMLFHCPDMGIVMTGTNDFIYGTLTPEQAMKNMEWMVHKMEEEKIRPVILTPLLLNPVMAAERWRPGTGVDYLKVNQEQKELARLIMSGFPEYALDAQNLFQEATGKMKPEEIHVDGLHPTVEGHKILAQIIMQEIFQ